MQLMSNQMVFRMLSICSVFVLASAQVFAQSDYDKKIQEFNRNSSFEFVVLHCSHSTLVSGETLFYVASVVPINTLDAPSVVVYVELHDSQGAVRYRQKVICPNGVGRGDFQIPRSLKTGDYTLFAYTEWMRNFSDRSFTRKQIFVLNRFGVVDEVDRKGLIRHVFSEKRDSVLEITARQNKGRLLLVRSYDEVLYFVELKSDYERIVLNNFKTRGPIGYVLMDNRQDVIEQGSIYQPELVDLEIREGALVKRGRYKVMIKTANSKSSPVSMSILSRFPYPGEAASDCEIGLWAAPFLAVEKDDFTHRRELYVLPSSRESPENIHFEEGEEKRAQVSERSGSELDSVVAFRLLEEYFDDSRTERDVFSFIQFDQRIDPHAYVEFESMEDFVRVLIPRLKVKKTGSKLSMQCRRESKTRVSGFYDSAPLMVIDNHLSSIEDFFALSPKTVELIRVANSDESIASTLIVGNVDFGLVVVNTNQTALPQKETVSFLSDFHAPIVKSQLRTERVATVPIIGNLIVWDTVVGDHFSFETGDRTGKIVIEAQCVFADGIWGVRRIELIIQSR